MTDRPEHPAEILDSGMQSERTYLAWQRTGLGFAANGALLLHAALDGRTPLVVPGLIALVVTALLVGRAQLRYRSTVAAIRLDRSPEDHRALAVTAALTAALCVTGLVAILLG
ncbi:DUF202 domain-containing protein [Frankia sp. AgB1.9]|uniref:DUF202 domain-containing protein n=1 Tax=unclassified Frankia TaxID=2632575 RepID=UPI001932970C|nr:MULTISPECIES: DUF202 domain-containing protein [unclassified Frankia]MBL7493419.1 DUF202 domain-containing protein [Frankia sp. AgW1.1]MBL7549062.1 DUF202 domain-containing protein [Frankia sp. AgB1.9]MBL7624293.1 DUF202 domain-containing protein [Frankia sp. AgB1.8]